MAKSTFQHPGASLEGADLTDADLTFASLDGADLTDAILDGARVSRTALAKSKGK
jgi:uncharacterized protein YjbI with pentapeptide repeats